MKGKTPATPIDVQTYLRGANYPANKDKLISVARNNEAPSEVIQVLRQMPDTEYSGVEAVAKACGKQT